MKRNLLIAGMAFVPLMFIAAVCGDETTRIENIGDAQTRGISVAGEGRVSAKPDVALITLGVTALRPTVAEARESAAASLTGMIDAIKAGGVAEKDIQTQQLSIYPEYDYNDGNQTLRGFRVSNTVTAKLRDVDKTGDIVDAAVEAGGDEATIQGIAFTIDDPEDLREQARAAAVADAKKRAETLASASGVEIGEPLSISEGGVFEPPIFYDRAAGAPATGETATTPIEPGELDVVINVNVTWAIK
jgi:uncharacterized protein YggE